MKATLAKLDRLLQKIRQPYYEKLNPGLTDQEIQALEQKYQLILPESLRLLYQWKNGQAADTYESFVNNSQFMPLEEALDTQAELTSLIGFDFEIENWWNEHWIPVFHNGGGDYICIDTEGTFTGIPGQLLEFWHADNDRNVIAPDLASFLNKLVQLYTSTESSKLDEYIAVESIKGYPLEFWVE
jgi:cell wall assembly regulator SMI1